MTRDEVARHTEVVARLASALSETSRLQAELQRARRQFFGDDDANDQDYAAEHRFAEWFLFERESETLGAVPVTVSPYCDDAAEVEDSISGLFLIEHVAATCTARDMQNGEILEIAETNELQVGDLLVGRLYPIAQERWSASAATPALRPGREIAEAFVRDVKALDLDRRLHQIELEHLLLRQHGAVDQIPVVPGPAPEPIAPLEHLEADLEQLLKSVGDSHKAEIISQQLAVAPRPGAFIGPILDQLAFDTDVDLDRARRLMLEIWNAHHVNDREDLPQPTEESSGPPGETLGERLVRKLDEGLSSNQNVEEIFTQMEEIAGIDSDEESGDDPQAALQADLVDRLSGDVDGDAGDLAPLVTEYRWETRPSATADAGAEMQSDDGGAAEDDPLELWVQLQRNAPVPNTDVESINTPDLMRLLLHVYLRSAPDERASEVRAAFDELSAFYDWLAATQEINARHVITSCRGSLLDHLDRLQAAGAALSNDTAPSHAPGLLQVEEIGSDGFGARDDDGGGHWLLAAASALQHLQVGDLVLAGLADGPDGAATSMHRRLAGMVVVLPIDARSMIE